MKLILFLFFIGMIGLTSALTCTDIFSSTTDPIQLCGYCYENNGSTCISSRACNITVYYPNGTNYLDNVSALNNGDGTITYNISNHSLSEGDYFGTLRCASRSKDDFSFTVATPATPGIGGSVNSPLGGRPYVLRTEIDAEIQEFLDSKEEKNRIPNDVLKYQNYLIDKLTPNSPNTGKFLFWMLLLLMLFSEEIFKKIKKIRMKDKW